MADDRVEGTERATTVPRFVVVAAFLGCLGISSVWALITPLMAAPDEATHMIRAVGLWHGDLIGRPFDFTEPGPPLVQATMFEVTVPGGYREISNQTACFDAGQGPAGCAPGLQEEPGERLMATIAGAYPPLWYGLYGAPSRLMSPTEAVYAARLASALVASSLVAAGLAATWAFGGQRATALALLGLTPVAAWLFGAINPNGLEIAGSFTLWSSVLALIRHPESRWLAGTVIVAAIAVAWSRPLSAAMVVGIIGTAMFVTADGTSLRALVRSRAARLAGGGVGVAVVSAGLWVGASGALDTFIAKPDASLTPGVAAAGSWDVADLRLQQMVAVFGSLDTYAPDPVFWVWGGAVAALALGGLWCGTGRQRVGILGLVVATVALPVVAEALTAAELGYTWQGRYTLPVAIGIVACSTEAITRGPRRLPPRVPGVLVAVIGVAVVVGHVMGHLTSMARYSTGPGTSLLGYLTQPGWSPPGPDVALLLGAAVGVGALVVAPWLPRFSTESGASTRRR
ncbi:MAG TPA: DUF2142 domain-containing protein [Euzebya sp.]|nr:DUF2142 domain-containing protein [Euzebya sp.]